MSVEIMDLTEKLLQYNRLFLKYYREGREQGIKYDFHETIKPFANEVKEVNENWKEVMKDWLKKASIKHIHLKQIETTSEHIEKLSIQCFFPESSKTRFLNTNRTVEYFLTEILKGNK
ncbi:YppE family protein [Neobacillus pocheonensis]|uniref:YppE family protein n=1 Tax=Neobacillus pocheonensis TaxID=363869 RepID=UPI003D27282C